MEIRKTIENYNFHITKKVTCSIGVAANNKSDSISNLLFRADMGLYKAKGSGRNPSRKWTRSVLSLI